MFDTSGTPIRSDTCPTRENMCPIFIVLFFIRKRWGHVRDTLGTSVGHAKGHARGDNAIVKMSNEVKVKKQSNIGLIV